MKLAILGGGGFRTPLMYEGLIRAFPRIAFDEVVLHDLDPVRLARIEPVLAAIRAAHGTAVPYRATTDLDNAVGGADFVFSSIRAGGLEGRVIDEQVPLAEGVLGQETTGSGGICFALRTVPTMIEIAETVARRAPKAWFINFTNPSGLVTEAIQDVLDGRAIGICDGPPAMCRHVAAAFGLDPLELSFDYFGLNHLGWLRRVLHQGRDILPDLLDDDEELARLEEGRLFDPDFLRSLGMLPNPYLYYYYDNEAAVAGMLAQPQTRAQQILEQQRAFYDGGGLAPAEAFELWREVLHNRESTYMREARGGRAEARRASGAGVAAGGSPPAAEEAETGGGYADVAIAVLESIALDSRKVMIVNTRNRGSLPFLDDDAVVEVPCVIDANGPAPLALGDPPLHARGLMAAVKDVERLAIDAARQGSRRLAEHALALHPLVPSPETARRIFAAYRDRHAVLGERFA